MDEFAQRRAALLQQLPNNSIVLIPSAKQQFRNADTEWLFRQESNFYYLTGFTEPEAILVLIKSQQMQFILFNRSKNPDLEVWTGAFAGQQGAIEHYGADQAYPIEKAPMMIPEYLLGLKYLYYPVGCSNTFDRKVLGWLKQTRAHERAGKLKPSHIVDVKPIIHELRLFKRPDEINNIQKATKISANAHKHLMKTCRPGLFEYHLEAEFFHFCRTHGCQSLAYPAIIGSGKNGCTLHYIENKDQLLDGELVLVDAGGECNYYGADITRTYPVNGRFSKEQQAIYELVLASQKAAIEVAKVGHIWEEIQQVILNHLIQGLLDLKILKGNVEQCLEEKTYLPFYMHGSGHWLGLDTHDAGAYLVNKKSRTLQSGMVFTIEPGIYIAPDNQHVDAKWHGIAVRIEDNIWISQDNSVVLSEAAPKEVKEIEELMRG